MTQTDVYASEDFKEMDGQDQIAPFVRFFLSSSRTTTASSLLELSCFPSYNLMTAGTCPYGPVWGGIGSVTQDVTKSRFLPALDTSTRADSPFAYKIPGKLNVHNNFMVTLEITAVEEIDDEVHVSFRWDTGDAELKTFPEVRA